MMRASIIMFIILYTSNSHAQPSRTGNDILPGCQAIVTNALPNDRILNIKIGYCMGAIAALGASDHVCAPDSSTTGQAIRIVAKIAPARVPQGAITPNGGYSDWS
jgi:hypothetical protein